MERPRLGRTSLVIKVSPEPGVGAVNFKRWLPNTNFENAENWKNGRLPCHNDHVVFPEDAPPVFVQINTTLVEIMLPVNGELILGSDMSLSFPLAVDNDSTCPGQEVEYNRTDPKLWFDPVNWCSVENPNGTCMDPQTPLLASQRIPSRYDAVIFPPESAFYIDLGSDIDIFVSSLTLGNRTHTTGSFLNLLRGEEGRKQFVMGTGPTPTTVNIRQYTCDDASGCATGNDVGQVELVTLTSIVSYLISAVKAIWCWIKCVAMRRQDVRLWHVSTQFYPLAHVAICVTEGSVDVIVSKTTSGKVQVVFRDGTGGRDGHALQLAEGLKEELQTDMREAGAYSVIGVELITSQPPPGASTGQLTGAGMTGRSIAGIVLSIIAVLVLVALGLYCLVDRDRCHRPFNFIRFGKEEEGQRYDLEMHGTQSISFRDLVAYGNDVQGFGNPVYDTPAPMEGTVAMDTPATLDLADVTFVRSTDPAEGFTNPLYGGAVQDLPIDSSLKLNPMYTDDGIEEDSEI
ncbi:hypothetical protein NP493_270g02016 [Ridgeia piscesae]|uniref:Protein amnionless n=1 Tax=Ridgeia piscesae TaxID=27915 RepID=A0AAD9NXI3_RIDPI|nr:hypothetical protein NP493_270g02016 [Ridgeia piscesae]